MVGAVLRTSVAEVANAPTVVGLRGGSEVVDGVLQLRYHQLNQYREMPSNRILEVWTGVYCEFVKTPQLIFKHIEGTPNCC